MRYLKICNANNMNEYNDAFRELGIALRNYAKLSGRWDLVNQPGPRIFYQGTCRVYAEYDVLYWAIDDPHVLAFLEQVIAFQGRFRRPELVRVVAQV